MTRPEGPYVVKLAREPGRRESRYAQLFTGTPEMPLATGDGMERVAPVPAASADGPLVARIETLEATVATLQRQLAELSDRLADK